MNFSPVEKKNDRKQVDSEGVDVIIKDGNHNELVRLQKGIVEIFESDTYRDGVNHNEEVNEDINLQIMCYLWCESVDWDPGYHAD